MYRRVAVLRNFVFVAISLLMLGNARAAAQGEAQLHILNAGINIGWAAGIVEAEAGVNSGNQAEVDQDLVRARDHVAALRELIASPPYETSSLRRVERLIDQTRQRLGGLSQGRAAQELYRLRRALRDALRVFLSARTGRLQQGATCDSAIVSVGFYFGQGHTLIQRGKQAEERRARRNLNRAIGTGERAAQGRHCTFAADTYRGLPMMSHPSGNSYGQSLTVAQRATGGAGQARAGRIPTPAVAPAVPARGGNPPDPHRSGRPPRPLLYVELHVRRY